MWVVPRVCYTSLSFHQQSGPRGLCLSLSGRSPFPYFPALASFHHRVSRPFFILPNDLLYESVMTDARQFTFVSSFDDRSSSAF